MRIFIYTTSAPAAAGRVGLSRESCVSCYRYVLSVGVQRTTKQQNVGYLLALNSLSYYFQTTDEVESDWYLWAT